MEIRHIMHTARSATIEIADGGRYFTKQPVELRVNGEPSLTTEKTITSLFSLKPDQKYVVEAYVNGEKQSVFPGGNLPHNQPVLKEPYPD